ncbi:STM3941 family protein [Bernardetia sp. ABR2-2B]|uniref:STM3941 family protein n=1 Tax=Bernardetia sp. ABR2-2B TaxID=3127472 RepID=UPI0030D4FEBA
MNEIKLYKSPLSAFYLFLGSFIFVIGGVFMVMQENSFMAWFALLFFGLCALVGLVMLFDKRPQIIINQKGIGYRKAIWKKYNPDDIIEWQTIKNIHWSSVNNQKFICLNTTSAESKKQNLAQKNLSKLNKAMGFEETNIPLSMIKIDANKLVDFLGSMAVSNESQREYLIKNFIIPAPKSFFSNFKF